MLKFCVFVDVAKGFARRYKCDDIDGLFFVVFYHGDKSVYGIPCGKFYNTRFVRNSYDVFVDDVRHCEYFYVSFNNTLVRFSADNFEDVSITALHA